MNAWIKVSAREFRKALALLRSNLPLTKSHRYHCQVILNCYCEDRVCQPHSIEALKEMHYENKTA